MEKCAAALMAAIIAFGAVFGIVTKKSFKNTINSRTDFSDAVVFPSSEFMTDDDIVQDISDAADEVLGSELMAVVRFDGERVFEHYSTRSTVSVLSVIKGDGSLAEKTIQLYEPDYFFNDVNGKFSYQWMSRFCLMQKGEEYVIFAKKIEYSKNRPHYLPSDIYIYANIDLPYFMLKSTDDRIISESSQFPVYYGDVDTNEFLCCSEYQKEKIREIKEEVFSELGVKTVQ